MKLDNLRFRSTKKKARVAVHPFNDKYLMVSPEDGAADDIQIVDRSQLYLLLEKDPAIITIYVYRNKYNGDAYALSEEDSTRNLLYSFNHEVRKV